jgi:hypothetical protein
VGWGRGYGGQGVDSGSDLTNAQCKAIGNWHNEPPCTMNT